MPPQRWNDAWTTNGAQDHRVRAYLRKHPSLPYLKQLADTPGNSIPLPLSQDVRAELDMLRFRVHANDAYDKTDTQTFLHWLDQAKEEDICGTSSHILSSVTETQHVRNEGEMVHRATLGQVARSAGVAKLVPQNLLVALHLRK